MRIPIISFVLSLFLLNNLQGQNTQDSLQNPIKKEVTEKKIRDFLNKKASFKVLFVGDYAASLTKDVDLNGLHNADNTSNGFYLKYVRLSGKFDLNKNLSVQVLVNLADFKNDPKNKVLEIATLKWTPSPYINLQLGQFRPYFGLEDMYPADIMKSNAWSNQYSLMGKSNWQSFQIGAAVFGSLKEKKIPLRYYYTFYNGNGKNQIQDNDDAKNHAFRLEYDILPNLQLGGNVGLTKVEHQDASIFGADLQFAHDFSDLWKLELNTEYKTGTNNSAFRASTLTDKNIEDFKMNGFYVTPSIARKLNKDINSFLEFSMRYENLTEIQNGNTGQFYTPMLSYVIGNDYVSKISLVSIFTDYDQNVAGTSQYDSTIFLLQYQLRF